MNHVTVNKSMSPERIYRRLRLVSFIGIFVSVIGLILIILQENVLLGIFLLIPGMVMVFSFKTATVLKMTYEMNKDKN